MPAEPARSHRSLWPDDGADIEVDRLRAVRRGDLDDEMPLRVGLTVDRGRAVRDVYPGHRVALVTLRASRSDSTLRTSRSGQVTEVLRRAVDGDDQVADSSRTRAGPGDGRVGRNAGRILRREP